MGSFGLGCWLGLCLATLSTCGLCLWEGGRLMPELGFREAGWLRRFGCLVQSSLRIPSKRAGAGKRRAGCH